MDKEAVLANAPAALNKADQPWEVSVEGDAIVGRWKWMDATFFAPTQITDEVKEFTCTFTLDDKGKWHEIDKNEEAEKSAGLGGLGASKNFQIGHIEKKSIEISFGKNKETGEVGLMKSSIDTSVIKKAIRDYLTDCGWKKPGLFG